MRKWVKTTGRWLWRVLAIGAVVSVVGYVGLQVGARVAIRKLVASTGLSGVTYEVAEVWPTSIKLTSVKVGSGADAVSLGAVGVRFSLWEVIGGKVRRVQVSGVRVVLEQRDGQWRIDGLPSPTGASPSGGASSAGLDLSLLPASIELSASVLELRTPAGQFVVPVDASIVKNANGGAAISATLSLGADKLTGKGTLDNTGTVRAEAAGRLRVAALLPILAGFVDTATVEADGGLDVHVLADTGIGLYDATATLNNVRVRTGNIAVRQLGGELGVKSSAGTLSARAEITGTATAQGILDGDSKFALTGSFADNVGRASASIMGEGIAVVIRDATLKVSGASGWSGAATIDATAKPTAELLGLAARAGVLVESPGAIVLKGKVAATKSADAPLLATASLSEVRVGTGRVRAVVGKQLATIDAMRAEWHDVNLDYSGNGDWVATNNGGPGCKISVDACSYGDVKVAGLTAAAPQLAVRMRAGAWEAGFPSLRIESAKSDIVAAGADIKGAVAIVNLAGLVSAQSADVRLLDESYLQVEAIRDAGTGEGTAGKKWNVDATKVWLRPGGNTSPPTTAPSATTPTTTATTAPTAPPPPVITYRSGHDLRVDVELETSGLKANASGATLSVGRVLAGLNLGLGDPLSLDGAVQVSGTDVAYPAADIVVRGLSLSLPISLDATAPVSGTFSSESVRRAGEDLPGISNGRMYVSRQEVWMSAEWKLVSEGAVKAEADVKFLGPKTFARLKAWVPTFGFTKTGELLRILPKGIADLDVTGTFDAKVEYYIDADEVVRWGEIGVTDATLKSKELDAELSGLNGKVWTRSFSPVETAAGQTLSVKSARMGKYAVTNGKIDFRIDAGDILFVESASFGFCGGEVNARGFRVAYKQNATDLTLYVDRVDLGALAKLVSDGRVDGTGKLFARLPVSVKWPDRLTLNPGYIYTEAGDGVISLGGNAADVARLISGASAKDTKQNLVQERVTAALVQFGYSKLSLEMTRETTGELTAKMRMSGKGDKRSDNQVLDLTFNINGLEDLISAGLLVKRNNVGF